MDITYFIKFFLVMSIVFLLPYQYKILENNKTFVISNNEQTDTQIKLYTKTQLYANLHEYHKQ